MEWLRCGQCGIAVSGEKGGIKAEHTGSSGGSIPQNANRVKSAEDQDPRVFNGKARQETE